MDALFDGMEPPRAYDGNHRVVVDTELEGQWSAFLEPQHRECGIPSAGKAEEWLAESAVSGMMGFGIGW